MYVDKTGLIISLVPLLPPPSLSFFHFGREDDSTTRDHRRHSRCDCRAGALPRAPRINTLRLGVLHERGVLTLSSRH